jgi:hypothetical protein
MREVGNDALVVPLQGAISVRPLFVNTASMVLSCVLIRNGKLLLWKGYYNERELCYNYIAIGIGVLVPK